MLSCYSINNSYAIFIVVCALALLYLLFKFRRLLFLPLTMSALWFFDTFNRLVPWPIKAIALTLVFPFTLMVTLLFFGWPSEVAELLLSDYDPSCNSETAKHSGCNEDGTDSEDDSKDGMASDGTHLVEIYTVIERSFHGLTGIKSWRVFRVNVGNQQSAEDCTQKPVEDSDQQNCPITLQKKGTGKTFGTIRSTRDKFVESCVKSTGSCLTVRAKGRTAAGVKILPNINYDFFIAFNGKKPAVSGFHDGYPSYIVKVNKKVVYYHQNLNFRQVYRLFGCGDVKVGTNPNPPYAPDWAECALPGILPCRR